MRLYILILTFCWISNTQAQICPGTPGQVTWELWDDIYDDEEGELKALHTYPDHPFYKETKFRTQSPTNFENYYGARMSGFIYVETATDVTFNITGDDKGRFYLSTNDNPDNLSLRAFHDQYTAIEEYDKFPTQTTEEISLVPGVDYYFELFVFERSGGDHSTLRWKTDLVDTANWNILTSAFIKDVSCRPDCPPLGTACDDGNSATEDDKEDGYCNCIGTVMTTNSCIGERGKVVKYRYENIPGNNLDDLYESANYPSMPDHSEDLIELGYGERTDIDDIGELLQGYITVPVTGTYELNLTGDNQTVFNLSSDENPDNMGFLELTVTGSTDGVEHDKYETQTSAPINLVAGQYYFYEVKHKEGSWREFFSVFWKSPFQSSDTWKRIPDIYLYDYTCNVSCIPQGIACDDGDPFTNNDQYNDNCECTGTPCSGNDCDDPLASYVPYDKCAVTDQLDDNDGGYWLSCEHTPNPNPLREDSHWIQYDMGSRHFLFQTQVWNYNVAGAEDQGFENVTVDYSLDGVNWTELGTYTWPLAPGETNYSGFVGPDFLGAEAQYVIFSSTDANPHCRGLGKVAFTAVKCPYEGTACDDGDHTTANDVYNDNCECLGTSYEENDCEDVTITLGDSLLTTQKYSAIENVQSVSEIDEESKVSFVGGDYVVLDVGFETQPNAVFIAAIDTCEVEAGKVAVQTLQSKIEEEEKQRQKAIAELFQVITTKDSDIITVKYYLDSRSDVDLTIRDINQSPLYTLSDHTYSNKGLYTKVFRTHKLKGGVYTVKIESEKLVDERRFTVE